MALSTHKTCWIALKLLRADTLLLRCTSIRMILGLSFSAAASDGNQNSSANQAEYSRLPALTGKVSRPFCRPCKPAHAGASSGFQPNIMAMRNLPIQLAALPPPPLFHRFLSFRPICVRRSFFLPLSSGLENASPYHREIPNFLLPHFCNWKWGRCPKGEGGPRCAWLENASPSNRPVEPQEYTYNKRRRDDVAQYTWNKHFPD